MPFYSEETRRKKQDADELAWLSNVYTLRAISTIGKGHFPERPMDIYNVTKAQEPDGEEEAEPMTDADFFSMWAIAFNKEKFGKGESEVRKEDV